MPPVSRQFYDSDDMEMGEVPSREDDIAEELGVCIPFLLSCARTHTSHSRCKLQMLS